MCLRHKGIIMHALLLCILSKFSKFCSEFWFNEDDSPFSSCILMSCTLNFILTLLKIINRKVCLLPLICMKKISRILLAKKKMHF